MGFPQHGPGHVPGVEGIPVDRLPVRQALQALQHHHRGHHARRDTAPTPVAEQIREHLIREQPVPFPVQQRIHRRLRDRLLTEPVQIIKQIALPLSQSQRLPTRSPTPTGILPGSARRSRQRHAGKDTSHPRISRTAQQQAIPGRGRHNPEAHTPFHLVALANQALTDVRRRVTWDTHGRRGRKNEPAWPPAGGRYAAGND